MTAHPSLTNHNTFVRDPASQQQHSQHSASSSPSSLPPPPPPPSAHEQPSSSSPTQSSRPSPSPSPSPSNTLPTPILPGRLPQNQSLTKDPSISFTGLPKRSRYRRSTKSTDDNNSDIRKGGRGSSFTPDEALSMAKAWIEESVQAPMGEFTKWGSIKKICSENYGMSRTPESLRCAWSRIAKECHNFLQIRKQVETEHINDGVTEDEIDALALESYRRKTGKTTNGVFHYGAPFKYYSTAKYLAKQPRFIEERTVATVIANNNNDNNNNDNNNNNNNNKSSNNITTATTPHDSNCNSTSNSTSDPLLSTQFPLALSTSDNKDTPLTASNDNDKSNNNSNSNLAMPPNVSSLHTDQQSSYDLKNRLQLEDLPEFRNLGDKSSVLRSKGKLAIDLNGGDILGRRRDENLSRRRDEDANDREEDFRLLQMLPRGSPEYMEIMQDIMKERRLRARERLARKELIVLDLERDVRRKRSSEREGTSSVSNEKSIT